MTSKTCIQSVITAFASPALFALAGNGTPSLPLDERSLWELDFPIREQHRLAGLIERGVLEIAPVAQAPLTDTHPRRGPDVGNPEMDQLRAIPLDRTRHRHMGARTHGHSGSRCRCPRPPGEHR
jgi:hypothetical protein